jgi:hypothetical protein
MRHLCLLGLIVFLISANVFGQDFLLDIKDIKRKIDISLLDAHLKEPEKIELNGAVFSSFMTPPYPSIYEEVCPELEGSKSPYEVLLILSQSGPSVYPALDESSLHPPGLLNPKLQPPPEIPVQIIAVKHEDLPVFLVDDPNHFKYKMVLKSESMSDQIHFISPYLEFKYSTGFKTNSPKPLLDNGNIDPATLNWVKRANLLLNLAPNVEINSDVTILETLVPDAPYAPGKEDQTPASLFDWTGLKFQRNSVNAKLGSTASLSHSIKLNVGLMMDSSPGKKTAGVMSSMDISIPNGSKILVFSSFKAPASLDFQKIPSNIIAPYGGGAGVEYETKHGIKIRGGVNGIGSKVPSIDAGIVIPADISPKR